LILGVRSYAELECGWWVDVEGGIEGRVEKEGGAGVGQNRSVDIDA